MPKLLPVFKKCVLASKLIVVYQSLPLSFAIKIVLLKRLGDIRILVSIWEHLNRVEKKGRGRG
jgi:hypothetical protein